MMIGGITLLSMLMGCQQLLARAEATFEPVVGPLLTHAARLSYLQPVS